MKQTVVIDGMSCANCAHTVKLKISDLPGINDIQVSEKTGRASYQSDRAISKEQLNQALRDTPYDVKEIH